MKPAYRIWLEQQGYAAGTVQAQMYRAGMVEECCGDLDEHYERGNTRTNLASYRNAAERYCKFRRETHDGESGSEVDNRRSEAVGKAIDERGQLVGLERDLQVALRRAIEQLEPAWKSSTMERNVRWRRDSST